MHVSRVLPETRTANQGKSPKHCRRRLCPSCSPHTFSLETLEAHLGSISLLADLNTITSEQDAADEKARLDLSGNTTISSADLQACNFSFDVFIQGSQLKEGNICQSLGVPPPDGDHTAGDPQRDSASSFNVFTQGSNEQHKENGIYESLGVAPLDQQPPDGDHTAGDPQRDCASCFNVFRWTWSQGQCETVKEVKLTTPKENICMANGPLLALKYKDRRDVKMLSTAHSAKFVGTGKRNRDQVEITKPECIHLYNKYMGTLDTSDQMHHPLPHPTTDAVCPTQDTLALQASCNNITFAHLIYLRSSTTLHLTHLLLLPSSCQPFLHQPLFQWPKVNVSRVGEYITAEGGENITADNITTEEGENITDYSLMLMYDKVTPEEELQDKAEDGGEGQTLEPKGGLFLLKPVTNTTTNIVPIKTCSREEPREANGEAGRGRR
ncbi:Hypp9577 [Branchiostoma lanceolatum]|uniref:Hypp9577 protein n=1 Tax=Branchiostoma lanceolatum TaxID=7740 RepID=A0A8S4MN49_BRALA|nr:Hypp9577 [Branchiostoma lanceolatum]